MKVVTDLHLHSKYSRAVSPQMIIPKMAEWAKIKGINLLGTGDFTHPLWLSELKSFLEECSQGVFREKTQNSKLKTQNQNLKLKSDDETKFLLTSEISSIYSQGGKTRKIHNIIIAPSFAVVEKINQELRGRGANLMSDGRPIIGLTCPQLCELVFSVCEECLIVPAHCLLPDEVVHVSSGIKKIAEIKKGDEIYTHKNRFKQVEKVFIRLFRGKVYKIIPDYFRLGVTVTGEHPFYAIKTKKNCPSVNKNFGICRPLCSQLKKGCARRYFEKYEHGWIKAENLQRGDILAYPRFIKTKDKKEIRLSDYLDDFEQEGADLISLGGYRRHKIPNTVRVDEDFCRLVGYFLAEGYVGKDDVSFCFHSKEINAVGDIKRIMEKLFGIAKMRVYRRKDTKSIELIFHSKILNLIFRHLFFEKGKEKKAPQKCLPFWMLTLASYKQKEILRGWWAGDGGYTTSRLLMNQMKVICLRLGIIPSVGIDTKEKHHARGKHNKFEDRIIVANYDTYHFSNLSFFEDSFNLLEDAIFSRFRTKMKRRRGWIDNQYVYLPIRKIEKRDYIGKVYNLEVKNDNSFTAEFACVHNCWTPWFSLYGSKSGFDSISECYGDLAKRIFAIETGLSSDPGMNWQIKELDNRNILSFSDAHSLANLGREMTVFDVGDKKIWGYEDIRRAIISEHSENSVDQKLRKSDNRVNQNLRWSEYSGFSGPKISCTVEFYPEEGKYHYTGHRNCNTVQSPEETKKRGTTCPVCGKPLTVGVMHRIQELAGSGELGEVCAEKDELGVRWFTKKDRPPYVTLVPLAEIIAEANGVGKSSQKVLENYENLISKLGNELKILTEINKERIAEVGGEKLAEGIQKVRSGDIFVKPGFDGEYGKVTVWTLPAEISESEAVKQISLFG